MAFRMVCALWVTPDFSEVLAGRQPPPQINHSAVDYQALVSFFEELFPYGPPVSIQVPNDTIDQVTIHHRQEANAVPTMRCEDFGQVLLGAAKKKNTAVVDIRASWKHLHVLSDRDFAPPPTLLPFVVKAADFEDAMIWRASTRPPLGLPIFDIMADPDKEPIRHDASLPSRARERLAAIFGCPFEASVVLDEMYADPRPAYAQDRRG